MTEAREVARQGLLRRPPGERITTTSGLRVGDVVQVAVELTDKTTGVPFWWRTFRVVTHVPAAGWRPWLEVLALKMHPEPDRDLREIDMRKDVVTFVPPESWPQGVAAMHMKLLTQRVIQIEGD